MHGIKTDSAPILDLPFSQAIEHNGFLFVSGQVPVDPETNAVVSDEITEQTRQTLENTTQILEAAGTSFDHVLKTTIYLTDIDHFDAVNKIYRTYVTEPYPARSAFAVDELAAIFETELLVVIDVIAAV